MASKSKFDIISEDDAHIIVKETPVHLTDEKIKSILYRTYLTLLTASFNETLGLEPDKLVCIAKMLLCISLLLGIVFLIIKLKANRQSDASKRDIAVEEVFSKYIKCD